VDRSVSASGRYDDRVHLVAHAGGWWELLIPLVIGFGLVFSLAMRRARGPEGEDESRTTAPRKR